jgi:hypothetical protein
MEKGCLMASWGKRLFAAVLTIVLAMGICGVLPQSQSYAADIGAVTLFFDDEPGIDVNAADNRLETAGWAWDGLDTLTINEKVNSWNILQIESRADHQTIHLIFDGKINLHGIYGDPKGSLVVDGTGTLSLAMGIDSFALSSGENLTLNSGIFQVNNFFGNGFAIAAYSGDLLIGGSAKVTATSTNSIAISGETGVTIKDHAMVTATGKMRGISAAKGSLVIGGNATVTATGDGLSAGLWAKNNITIGEGARVSAYATGYLSDAIMADSGSVRIDGSASVIATAGGDLSSGIYSKGMFIKDNATLQAHSSEYAGLYSYQADIAIGGDASVLVHGKQNGIISWDGNVAIGDNAKVYAQANSPDGDSAAMNACGVGSVGHVSISGSADVTAVVLSADGFSLKSDMEDGIAITGGTARLYARDKNHTIFGISPTIAPVAVVSKEETGENFALPALAGATMIVPDQVWTGQPLTPDITVRNGAVTLHRYVDYNITEWINNTDPGTATVTIKGVGLYTGTASRTFTITKPETDSGTAPDDGDTPGDLSAPIAIAKAAAKVADRAWTGKAQTPALTLTCGDKPLLSGRDYEAVYRNNVKIGKATVVVTGKGDYTGSRTLNFKIIPKKPAITKLITGVKQVKVLWNKAAPAQKITKYQLRYRVRGKGKWTTKTLSAKTLAFTITKLKKGRIYQLQLRTCKTVSKVNYYSAWSPVKTSRKVKH